MASLFRKLPIGGEFTYRTKAWPKGMLPDETERQLRVVRAVNVIGRYWVKIVIEIDALVLVGQGR